VTLEDGSLGARQAPASIAMIDIDHFKSGHTGTARRGDNVIYAPWPTSCANAAQVTAGPLTPERVCSRAARLPGRGECATASCDIAFAFQSLHFTGQ